MAENIAAWLEEIGLSQYESNFAEHHVSLGDLSHFSPAHLRSLGISNPAHVAQILGAAAQLAEAGEGVQPPAAPTPPSIPAAWPGAGRPPTPPSFPAAPVLPAPALPAGVVPEIEITPTAAPATGKPNRRKLGFWATILASKFLLVSIAAHVLFGVGATYYVVAHIQARRKVSFDAGPPVASASKHALEHKVSMAQKKKSGGAPPQAKRILTAGLSKIALPEMPTMPTATTVSPAMSAGMGGAGFGTGMGFGNGSGSGLGGNGGGGGGFSFFGFRGASPTGLTGYFYDLKQTRAKRPTKIGEGGPLTPLYTDEVKHIARAGLNEGSLSQFYRVSQALSASQFFIPILDAQEGPKAYGAEKEVEPGRWVAVYRGRVSPPKSGTYRFVGGADDVMLVKFNGRLVLDGSLLVSSDFKEDGVYKLNYGGNPARGGFVKGKTFRVEADESYEMDVLIGERPGGLFWVTLLIEEEGVDYKKDGSGNPILPLFRLTNTPLPADAKLSPMTDPNGPVWKMRSTGSGSLLDSLKH